MRQVPGRCCKVGQGFGKDAPTLRPSATWNNAIFACASTWVDARARCAPFILAVALLGCAADLAASDITLPMPPQSAPVTVRAGGANRWDQNGEEIWVLRDGCQIVQDATSAQGRSGVIWLHRSDALSDQPSRLTVYLEGDVSVDTLHDGRPHASTGRAGTTVRDQRWLGRFYSSTEIVIESPVTGFRPEKAPPILQRAQAARQSGNTSPVQPAQFTDSAPGNLPPPNTNAWTVPNAPVQPPETVPPPTPGPTARSLIVNSRSNVRMHGRVFPSADGMQTIAVVTSGVRVVVDGIENIQGLQIGKIDIETDRIVIWTARLDAFDLSGESSGAKMQPKDAPLEFYMEGNIVFREGDRVIYAERMYYNVRERYGMILNAEVLTPAPGYQGLVRLKADVLQQLNESNFQAYKAALTSSRMGVPRYWLQADQVDFTDVQTARSNPFTGQAEVDMETGEPLVDHQYLASSRNNFLYLGGIPVLWWPVMATDLREPTYYVKRIQFKNDSVFGFQALTEFDMFQLLGVRNKPPGTEWTISPDYLDDRGFALGTSVRYDTPGLFGLAGPMRGYFDAWGLKDRGLDNLGADRRAVAPRKDYRGRVLWQHRHYLPNAFQLTAELGLVSDRNFLEQYYENEWDQNKDQTTGLELKQMLGAQTWSLAGDVRANDFFTQTESLPRFQHTLLGFSIFDRLTWFAHTDAGYERLKTSSPLPYVSADEPTQAPMDWETDSLGTVYDQRTGLRASTRHELDLPMPVGPFKFTPYVAGEASYWQEDRDATEVTRLLGQAGIRGSIPLWSVDPDVNSLLFNLDGLAHKVVLDADFMWADADQELNRFPLYDPLDDDATEHFRRRFLWEKYGQFATPLPAIYDPLHFAQRAGMQGSVVAPSTEIADDLMMLRAGIRQRWQTKRGFPGQQRIVDWITLDLEGTFFPKSDRDNFGKSIGLVNYDFRWHLGDRFSLLSDGFYDFFPGGLQTTSIGGLISRPLRGSLYLGYRWSQGPFQSSIISANLNYRMSDKWIVNAGAAVDMGDAGDIGQNIDLVRVGESLLVRVGFNVDHSRDNVGIAFSIEPRFLPGKLGRVGGVPIPPVGALGVE